MTNKLEAISGLYHALERADIHGIFTFREVSEMADTLRISGNSLRRIHENECNGIERWDAKTGMRVASWTDEDQQKADKAIERYRFKALSVVDKINELVKISPLVAAPIVVGFNSDPRGPAIKLFVDPEDPDTGTPTVSF